MISIYLLFLLPHLNTLCCSGWVDVIEAIFLSWEITHAIYWWYAMANLVQDLKKATDTLAKENKFASQL